MSPSRILLVVWVFTLAGCSSLGLFHVAERRDVAQHILVTYLSEEETRLQGTKPDYVWFIHADATTVKNVVGVFADSATLTVRADNTVRVGPAHVVTEKGTGKHGGVLSVDRVIVDNVPQFLLSRAGLPVGGADAVAWFKVYASSMAVERGMYFLRRTGRTWHIVKKLEGPVS
jgi:hypothetical protein